ncbi:hypothetical protein Pan153_02450 [Gimesia panareensis]|uniref:Uncharacterized protein n=1 Tax=Gimesia panareensis TaxID=2527978 RepID=A0A518FH09_9PLAN|nr:hypothetical protein Pan153_02450 [Gimesia panareensis]
MVFQPLDPGDKESFDKMRELFSSAQVDQSVRQALQL